MNEIFNIDVSNCCPQPREEIKTNKNSELLKNIDDIPLFYTKENINSFTFQEYINTYTIA